jgi:hypothetical protein
MLKVLTAKRLAFLGLTVAVAMILASQDQAEARPKYLKGFATSYKSVAPLAKKAKCGVCHYGKSKKNRNDYGKAMMKNVKKNEKGAEAITAAIKKTEAAKNAKGVTFGSLIKAGKLPGTAPAK